VYELRDGKNMKKELKSQREKKNREEKERPLELAVRACMMERDGRVSPDGLGFG
jgi:hypothetical protein